MKAFSHLLFAVLAALALFTCASVVVSAFTLVNKPFIGFSLVEEGLVNPSGLTAWGASDAGFHFWDRIIAVDGELVFSKDDVLARAYSRPVESAIVYQVEGIGGDARFVELKTRMFALHDLVNSQASQAMLGLIFVVIAVLLYFLRPGTAEAWSFFLLFAGIGVSMASVTDMTLLWQQPPLFRFTAPFLGTLGIVLVGVVTGAYTQVPGARALEGALEQGDPGFDEPGARLPQRRMWILTALCALVSLAIAIGLQLTVGDVLRYVVIDSMLYAWLGVCILVGLALLTVAYVRGRSPRRRARIRQILWAWPVGAGIPVANLFLGQVLEISPFSLIWNAFLLLVPISTADAIVRHDLLRLNATARRLVGGLTVAAVVGIGLGIVMYFAVTFLKVNEPSAMVALAAVLFAVAAPLSHRVQSNVESLLRQRRYDAGRLLADFTARASTATQLGDLLEKLKQVLEQSIQPSGFQLYRLDRSANQLVPQGAFAAPVVVDATIAPWLERADPWIVDDEAPAPASLGGAALAVRLAVANEPVGLLVVKHRAGKTPYEAADVGFVLSLAGPLAAALVNALAFDAVARLNRELEDRVQARTKELEQKNAELALMNTRKDELVATVSHDFRSPLATIKQNVQTILKDLPRMDKDDVRMFVEAISRQETRLTALCINLLDLARLRQRSAPQDPVRLDEVARRLVEEMLPRAQEKGVALALDVAAGAPVVVRGDATRLAQVLQNLVDNAIKFTGKDGHVALAFTRDGAGDPLEGARLRIDVTDDGIGVPADALPRLFEPFFQVPSQSHAGEGSGLGLAIVKAVVEAHGGTIRVSSEVGKGTTFSLVFPAEVASGQHAPRQAAE